MAERVSLLHENGTFAEFFGPETLLLPVPGSTPRRDDTTLWVAERICNALLAEGLGDAVMADVRRVRQVPKSAYQAPGDRPNAQVHFDTITVQPQLINPIRILLVDDIVTKGNTLLGCASRAAEAFPQADIRAFAMVRTMGLVPDIDRLIAPCVGRISLVRGGEAVRVP